MNVIDLLEKEQLKAEVPVFRPGDVSHLVAMTRDPAGHEGQTPTPGAPLLACRAAPRLSACSA